MSWTVSGSNPGNGEIFSTLPELPRGPPNFLYDGYRVSFPAVMREGCGVGHPPPSSAEAKQIQVYLYLCSVHKNILFCVHFYSLYIFKYNCRVSSPQILITYYICACSEGIHFTGNRHRNAVIDGKLF